MSLFSRLVVGLVVISCPVGHAQPWSIAATNSAAARPAAPAQNLSPATAPAPTPYTPAPAVHAHAQQPVAAPSLASGPLPAGVLTFDAEQKEYQTKAGEVNCPFVFAVTNSSAEPVSITFIQTSCGCTTANLKLPLTLPPGGMAEIPVMMNVAGKSGVVIKTVTLHTDKGYKALIVKGTITEPPLDPNAMAMNRDRNQQLALADRQAVFKGDCARCHVEPLIGKMGHELYTAACGICHEAEHRASMVPDLHALKVTPNAEYWKFYIANGKPATLMPAFAQSQGGPLSDAQIASLVEYLVKEFPHSKTNAPTHAKAH